MPRPKICLLFAGGTIGMIKDPSSGALRPASDVSDFLRNFPELQKHIQLDYRPIFNLDSSCMQPSHWTQLAHNINKYYHKYNGFVIAQGTDTMAYTSSALSFALQNLSKPIVLTGSLVPIGELGADAHNNFIFACLTAAMDIAEVCIMFGHKITRGNRTKKHHESFVNVFHSPNFPMIGEIGRPIKLNEWRKKRRKRVLLYNPEFESKVSLLKLYPGFNPNIIDLAINRGAKGIVIEGFGPGNVPFLENSIIPNIESAVDKGVPVIIANQMENGITNLNAYEAGYHALKAGAISSQDMTTEATLTKLMWTLAQTNELDRIKKTMQKNLSGELTPSY
jgi:L-asparaginase